MADRARVVDAARGRWSAPVAAPTPITVHVIAVYPRPRARPGWAGRAAWATGTQLPRPCTPDADNAAKCILDALQGIAYEDDGQVTDLVVVQRCAARGEEPSTLVTVAW